MKSNYFLKFYADTPIETNKLFKFNISSRFNASNALLRFTAKGWKIKAAWLCNRVTGSNERIA